jgi:glycosyltransferase involved in cell wall biosynthesis
VNKDLAMTQASPPQIPRVALYADRLARRDLRGLDVYYRQLIRALQERHGADRLQVIASPDRRPAEPGAYGSAAVTSLPGPRRPLHLAWAALRRPAIDRWIPAADVVHVMAPTVPIPTAKPVVMTVHDLTPITHPHWHEPHARWLFTRTVQDSVRRGDRLIATSEFTRRDLTRVAGADPERVTVVHLGVDPLFAPVSDSAASARVRSRYGLADAPYLLWLGASDARKNLPLLLDAFDQVRRHDGQQRLVLAGGRGRHASSVTEAIEARGLTGHVVVTGYVERADLPVLMSDASVFVFPSLDEGFGLPPLEAMACGTPVIASTGGSLPEIVGDAARVVEADDAGALARAIAELTADERERERLSGVGLARVREFDWARTAEQTSAVYAQVHAASPRG